MQTELIITVAAAVICYPSIRQQLAKYLGTQLLHGSSPLACSQCSGIGRRSGMWSSNGHGICWDR